MTKRSRRTRPSGERDSKLKDSKALLKEAQRLEAKADRLEQKMLKEVEELRRKAAAWKVAAKTVAAEELPQRENVRTLPGVEARTVRADEARRPGAPLLSDHPFAIALENAGLTAAAWGKKHGVSEEKVRSWYRRVDPRRVPRKYAREIERELGLPVSGSSWPNGIRG